MIHGLELNSFLQNELTYLDPNQAQLVNSHQILDHISSAIG